MSFRNSSEKIGKLWIKLKHKSYSYCNTLNPNKYLMPIKFSQNTLDKVKIGLNWLFEIWFLGFNIIAL